MPSKKDLVLLALSLLLTGLFCVWLYFPDFGKTGDTVDIFLDSEKTNSFSLRKDQTIDLAEHGIEMTLEIRNGRVDVLTSGCPGQDCVHSPAIHRAGQSILCAAQKTLITIHANTEPDAVVK